MRIIDIKMIVTHLTLLSLGTPGSMKHQSDSASLVSYVGGVTIGGLRLSITTNKMKNRSLSE